MKIYVIKHRTCNAEGRLGKWKHRKSRTFSTTRKEAEVVCEAVKRNVGERDYRIFCYEEKR